MAILPINHAVSFPHAAIYTADENGKRDQLLFGRTENTTAWRLESFKVSRTRMWAVSTAQITLSRSMTSSQGRLMNFHKETNLSPEDLLIIYGGYAQQLFIEDESTIYDFRQLTTPYGLHRMFFGKVDTIQIKGNKRGIIATVSLRDHMAHLVDNNFSGQLWSTTGGVSFVNQFDEFQKPGPDIIPLTLEELNDCVSGANLGLETGYKIRPTGEHKIEAIIAWLIYAGSNGAALPAPVYPITQFEGDTEVPDPAMAESERAEIKGSAIGAEGAQMEIMTLMNRKPIEAIKHIGSLEATPRELYADVYTGRICWRPRQTFHYSDPFQFCAMAVPPEAPEGVEPNVTSWSADWSTIGLRTELILVNPNSNKGGNGSDNGGTGVTTFVGRMPDDRFYKREINTVFPGLKRLSRRTNYIFDDVMTADLGSSGLNDNSKINREVVTSVMNSFFSIWGRDIRAGEFITGQADPRLGPGDAIQTWNMGFFDGQVFRVEAITTEYRAGGANRGFVSHVFYAETDEDRQAILDTFHTNVGGTGPDGKSNYTQKDTDSLHQVNKKNVPYAQGPGGG